MAEPDYTLSAEISPDLAPGFTRTVQQKIDAALAPVRAKVEATVELNTRNVRADLTSFARSVTTKINLEVKLDTRGVKADLTALARSVTAKVTVGVKLDTRGVRTQLTEFSRSSTAQVSIGMRLDTRGFRAELRAYLDSLDVKVHVGIAVDTAGARAQLDKWRAGARADVRGDINLNSQGANIALDSVGSRWKLILGGILASTPFIGGAIIAAAGTGFIAIGALAQKSNAQVKAAYSDLWKSITTETKAATDQMVPYLVSAAGIIRSEAASLAPQLKTAFGAANPDLLLLTHGVTDFATRAMPGATAAVQNSQPVFQGLRNLLGSLGQSAGDTLDSMSQHSAAFGRDLTSLGNIVSAVMRIATAVVNTAGEAWAAVSDRIDGVFNALAATAQRLAGGALPGITAALAIVATALGGVLTIAQPIIPVLGFLAGAFATVWAVMKAGAVVSAIVRTLAGAAATATTGLGVYATSAATSAAATGAIGVAGPIAARGLTAAGTAAGFAARGFGALEAFAGPIGWVLLTIGAIVGIATAVTSSSNEASQATKDLENAMDALRGPLTETAGAWSRASAAALQGTDAFKAAAADIQGAGLSIVALDDAAAGGIPALNQYAASLREAASAKRAQNDPTAARALDDAAGKIDTLAKATTADTLAARENTYNRQQANLALIQGSAVQGQLSTVARALGLDIGTLSDQYIRLAQDQDLAAQGSGAVASALVQAQLKVKTAEQSLIESVKQRKDAVVAASSASRSANEAYQQSLKSVSDAVHSYQQSVTAVGKAQAAQVTAVRGVDTATKAYHQAQTDELKAQQDINVARQQAIQDLKELHLQLEDQTVSEGQARVGLFDANAAAVAGGIDPNKAKEIAAAPVTADNEAQVKLALDLLDAQNRLNDTMNTGGKLRAQVQTADANGVSKAPIVLQAQVAYKNAQEQTANALVAVNTANQGLVDAKGAVLEAEYAEGQAADAVGQARLRSKDAADKATLATRALRDANAANSQSMDLTTAAGITMANQISTLAAVIDSDPTLSPLEKYNTKLNDIASIFGISRDRAKELLDQLGQFPPTIQTDVKINYDVFFNTNFKSTGYGARPNPNTENAGDVVTQHLSLDQLKSRQESFQRDLQGVPNPANFHAAGGLIRGPGTGTSDSIPAWLSNGEYVMPADETARYLPVLMAMRAQRFAAGGLVGTGQISSAGSIPAASDAASAVPSLDDAVIAAVAKALNGLLATVTDLSPALAAMAGQTVAAQVTFLGLATYLTTTIIPILLSLEAHAGTTLPAALGVLMDANVATEGNFAATWADSAVSVESSVARQVAALGALRSGYGVTQSAASAMADWLDAEFHRAYAASADPIRMTLDLVVNQGLVAAWNALDTQFAFGQHVNPVAIPFATGGHVPGSGSGDTVPAMLTPGEYVWTTQAVRNVGGTAAMDRLHSEAQHFANGGTVLAHLPGGANFGPNLAETTLRQFPSGIRQISGFRAGSEANGHLDMHSQGKAVDISADDGLMTRIAKWIYYTYPTSTELIHWNPDPKDNLETQLMNKLGNHGYHNYLKDGPGHRDHVHWGINDLGEIGNPAPAGAIFAGAGGSAPTVDYGAIVAQAFQGSLDSAARVDGQFPGNIAARAGTGISRAAIAKLTTKATELATTSSGLGGSPFTGGDSGIAQLIMQIGKDLGFGAKGAEIALITAMVESGIHNLNYGDRDSLGVFQQRPSQGWGTPAQLLDPNYATRKFYQALGGVNGWQGMDPGVAAQRVQRSAFPERYDQKLGAAMSLVNNSGLFDNGGWMGPGLHFNGLSTPEAVLTPTESAAYVDQARDAARGGREIRLDTYSINRLAQALAAANTSRPILVTTAEAGLGGSGI